MTTPMRLRAILPAIALAASVAGPAAAQDNAATTAEAFIRPSDAVAEAVMAPRHLNVTVDNPSPDGRFFLTEREAGPPTMADFAKPFHRLAGEQIDWRANRSRNFTTRAALGLDVMSAESGAVTAIEAPNGARVSSAQWSPDGSRIAFFVHQDDATHLYVADPSSGSSRQVTRTPVMATLYTSFAWTPDSRSLVTLLVPENRGPAPATPAVPVAPQVRHTTPEKNTIRTYPDLLESEHEKALLAYYSTGQLAVIDVERRRARPVGAPAMVTDVTVSPDGMHALVTTMREPFSYIVPRRQFGSAQEIWGLADGAVMALVHEEALRDGSPDDTANGNGDPERRSIAWRPDGQGLGFLQMTPRQPGDTAQSDAEAGQGEERQRSRRRDRVVQWLPPFDSASQHVVYENAGRLSNVRYAADAQTLFLSEQQGQNGHDFAVRLSDTSTKHTIWRGERQGGFGGFGGSARVPRLLTATAANGAEAVRVSSDGNHVFLSGTDYADDPMLEGPRSYIDRVEIDSGEKTRVYEGDNDGVYERVVEVLDHDATRLVVSRESPTEVPNSYLRDLGSGELRQLTENADYTPALTGAQRRRYAVTRADGFEMALNVTLPADWAGERLPGMIWFYPREYTDQEDYDETRETYNKNRYPSIGTRSIEILALEGYAVIQPDAPIVGESGRMNDNYVHDLRNNLSAVIDFVDREGIVDRQRLGVGGHSYGAFSTVNAMVHTPFFKAGIAGDGNYNRTLTPFSFQSERRSLWEARDLYFSMSPFFYANNLTGALLLYHGEHDQNVGTFPIHSWRLFEALESLGKTASLYVYPYEDHGPATEETLLDLWARWTAWLDTHVKNAGSPEDRVTTDGMSGGAQP